MKATGGQASLAWAKGSRGLSAMWCLLHDLQVAGMDRGGFLRGWREAWPATTVACESASPAAPVTSGVDCKKKKKKKKRERERERGHCNQAPHIIALTPLGTHPPSS